MNKRIFTGNYEECKAGNLISISGDRGADAGFIRSAWGPVEWKLPDS